MTVGVRVDLTQIAEGAAATFQVHASALVAQDTVVNYAMSGTAMQGSDYTLTGPAGTVTIRAGRSEAKAKLKALRDHTTEGTETAIMTLQPGSGYQLGNKIQVTVSITDSP